MNRLVMIIDDSEIIRKIVEVSLGRAGITCVSYADGIEALRALASRPDLVPDVILLDVGMPKMDGYQVAQYIRGRRHYKDTTIVMLSGRDGVLDRLKGRLAGASSYLTKPFRTQELMAVVDEYLSPGVA
ncbi:MAG: response regulator [Chloroflexota bacterium]|nr:response regulator [Chloroflexota bacterium]